jgi:hypothetical protein
MKAQKSKKTQITNVTLDSFRRGTNVTLDPNGGDDFRPFPMISNQFQSLLKKMFNHRWTLKGRQKALRKQPALSQPDPERGASTARNPGLPCGAMLRAPAEMKNGRTRMVRPLF